MNFDLADLRAFLAVADLGSFKAASAAIHLSQSALSRRIDKLETALGVLLFERTTRKVELTTVGRSFVPKARSVLNELDSALLGISDVAERISGEVTIACVPSAVAYFLPDVMRTYHRKYPGIRIRVIDESSFEILLNVVRGEADFGLTLNSSRCCKTPSWWPAPKTIRWPKGKKSAGTNWASIATFRWRKAAATGC
jgi:DNA-binding transcriptional LysR family regulator